MNYRFLITMLTAIALGQTVSAQSVFSPTVNKMRSDYQTRRAASSEAAQERTMVIVTCSAASSPAEIANQMKAKGAIIRTLMGTQIIVDLPKSSLDEMAAIDGVLLVDLPDPGQIKTDIARRVSCVDGAHAGKMEGMDDLPQAYTGKGIIIGLIDIGFDYTHPMFKDKQGNLRIKGVYQPGAVDAAHTKYSENLKNIEVFDERGNMTTSDLSGSFYTNPDVILDTTIVRDQASDNHGTHCASIAAGSMVDYTNTFTPKYTNSGKLGGMAPDADIMLSEVEPSDEQKKIYGQYIDYGIFNSSQAISALSHFAEKAGKPLIISWSENNHLGFHDGTSSIARYVGSYCKKGNIMALCSSNEGNNKMHHNRTISKGQTVRLFYETAASISTGVLLIPNDPGLTINMDVVDIDEKEVFRSYNLNMSSEKSATAVQNYFACTIAPGGVKASNGYQQIAEDLAKYAISSGSLFIEIISGTGLNKQNKSFPYTRITIDTRQLQLFKSASGKQQYLRFRISSPNGDAQVKTWGDYCNLFWNDQEGSTEYSTGDWNTSGEPVVIGAYCTDPNLLYYNENTRRLEWLDETTLRVHNDVGRYANFSSYGYDYSGTSHVYPDVSAPGVNIYAAANSFYPQTAELYASYTNQFKGQTTARNYPYTTMSGTSMSTPAAAGIMALWMQAAKEKGKPLTNAYMKEVIKNSSDNDEWTANAPIRYGAGKMNAYKGLIYILDLKTSIPDLPTQHIGARLEGHTLYINGDLDTQVEIYNLSGQKVLDVQATQGVVNLPNLPAGVYAVKIGNQGSTLIRL